MSRMTQDSKLISGNAEKRFLVESFLHGDEKEHGRSIFVHANFVPEVRVDLILHFRGWDFLFCSLRGGRSLLSFSFLVVISEVFLWENSLVFFLWFWHDPQASCYAPTLLLLMHQRPRVVIFSAQRHELNAAVNHHWGGSWCAMIIDVAYPRMFCVFLFFMFALRFDFQLFRDWQASGIGSKCCFRLQSRGAMCCKRWLRLAWHIHLEGDETDDSVWHLVLGYGIYLALEWFEVLSALTWEIGTME